MRHWGITESSLSSSIRTEKRTDAAGGFRITGMTGDGFDIEAMSKAGYELEPTPLSYGASEGSATDPITFKMWSTNVHEQLITGRKSFPFTPDGRSYTINLTAGTIAESGDGDLKVWVKRPDPIIRGQHYDWSCGIDVLDGGLLEDTSAAGAMYEAPAEGYTPSFRFEQKVGSGWGDVTPTKRFFLALKGGKEYAKISIDLYAYYNKQNPGMVRIGYALNPSGSRILR